MLCEAIFRKYWEKRKGGSQLEFKVKNKEMDF